VRDLGLREAADRAIFLAVRSAAAIVMTKDIDFVRLIVELGPPPQVIWLTCGNTSNAHLKQILTRALPGALSLLKSARRWSKFDDVKPGVDSVRTRGGLSGRE
jgi:predicted nuclease of predicted toxin-antitoxin system